MKEAGKIQPHDVDARKVNFKFVPDFSERLPESEHFASAATCFLFRNHLKSLEESFSLFLFLRRNWKEIC